MSLTKVAVPAEDNQGLDSPMSGHFGHSPGFVVAEVSDDNIENVKLLLNSSHSSCAEPVQLLAQNGVTVLIARGMGRRPLMISQNLGIRVVISNGTTVREAIETLIYIYEVEKVRSRKDLLEHFAYQTKDLRLPPYDDFSRYCIKMATGSGRRKAGSCSSCVRASRFRSWCGRSPEA